MKKTELFFVFKKEERYVFKEETEMKKPGENKNLEDDIEKEVSLMAQ